MCENKGTLNPAFNTVTTTVDRVREAAQAYPDSVEVLKMLFPRAFPVDRSVLVTDDTMMEIIGPRVFGSHEHRAFYLMETYDWELTRDSEDYLVLVPTKKL